MLHSLFANAIDGLRPNSAYADPYDGYPVEAFARKKTLFSFIRGITLMSEMNTWVYIGPAYQGNFVAT